MPIYAFACLECGSYFEKQLPYQHQRAEITCPKGHLAVRRLYSPPQVVFKGSGWYSTDKRPTAASTSE